MKMKTILHVFGFFMLFSCDGGFFKKAESKPPSEEAAGEISTGSADATVKADTVANPLAAEPVAVGGAYLVCSYTANGNSQMACRLEDHEKQKVSLDAHKGEDLTARSPDANLLDLQFALAPSISFWHWISVEDTSQMEIASISLSERFTLDSEESYSSPVLDIHTDFPIPTPPAVPAAEPPVIDIKIELLGLNSVKANGYVWWHASAGDSCSAFCSADRGEFNASVTAEGVKDQNFCLNVFSLLYSADNKPAPMLVHVPDNSGFGCYSTGAGAKQQYFAESGLVFDPEANAPGVRRLCACGQAAAN